MLSPDTPFRRRVTVTLLATTGIALLLSCLSFIGYEFLNSGRELKRSIGVLSQKFAQVSANALANDDMTTAAEVIGALEGDRSVTAAALYDRRGRLRLRYPRGLDAGAVPATPGAAGEHYEDTVLKVTRPVMMGEQRVGTVYLEARLFGLSSRIASYSLLAGAITALCFLITYLLSRGLQRQISDPVLELAATARAISERHDYSVRSPKRSNDEFGLLTDAFNHMLSQIQAQDRQVRESEARVHAVIDSALSAVIVTDIQGRIVNWNAQAHRLFGWTLDEALGRDLPSLILTESSRERYRAYAQRLVAGEAVIFGQVAQVTAQRRDGEEFLVEASTSAFRSGDTLSLCTFVTDVTARQQADLRLRSSQVLLRSIIDNSTALVYAKDVAGRYIMVNRRYEELFHLTRAWVMGKTDYDLFPTLVADGFRSNDNQVITSGVPVHCEETLTGKDGIHTYMSNKFPLYDTDGKLYAVCGISADITERKHSERQQRQQLNQLELLNRITRAISDRQELASIYRVAIGSLEDDLPVDFACVLRHSAQERTLVLTCVGRSSTRLAVPLGLGEHARVSVDQEVVSRCMRGELAYVAATEQVNTPLAQAFAHAGLHSLVMAPLLAEGQVTGALLTARQRTAGFTSSDCELLRQLSDHVGLAAHQTELHGALQQAYDDLHQSQHALMQQDRLRANSRPQSAQPASADIQINHVIRSAIDLTRARWEAQPRKPGAAIDIRTDLCSPLPTVTGAEGEIRDTLICLICNAVEAMPAGGTLTLRTAMQKGDDGGHVSMEIQDTGVGMDEETRRHCLEPHFIAKSGQSQGLGLGTVYGTAQRHGAELQIDSAPGQGTTVRLIFAAAADRPALAGRESWRLPRPLNILIVDDDPFVLDALREVLRTDAHTVTALETGQAAIDCFMEAMPTAAFDLVITDLGMPYVDGGRVAAAVKGIAPMTPVILLTGWGHRILGSGELPQNVDCVLAKPARLRELRNALKLCCDTPAVSGPSANSGPDIDPTAALAQR